MKITIEIWQSDFNDQWYCDVNLSSKGEPDEKGYFEFDTFSELLESIKDYFPNGGKIRIKKNEND